MARKTSVVARCAVFCNGFAPLFDERVKKVRCKKSGSARRTVFCNGFAPFIVDQKEGKRTLYCFLQWFLSTFCPPKAPKMDAVLFFATALNRLPLPPARLASDLRPACVRLVSDLRPTLGRRKTLHPCGGSAVCVESESFI